MKVKKVKDSQYWEWRCTIEELKNAELNKSREELAIKLMEKDIELSQLRLKIRKQNFSNLKDEVKKAQNEYDRFKKELEEKMGMKLDNVSINPVTFEIHDLT